MRATRAMLDRVDWECEVQTCFSETNLGCGKRIATGLDWVFAQAQEAIILEDDCVPDPTFFPFCEQLLSRFRDDERVWMIGGSNVMEPDPFPKSSYCYSRGYQIWGWATWARAWRDYDFEMKAWPQLRETDWLSQHVRSPAGADLAQLLLDGTYDGRIRQWDFQWVLAGWIKEAVSVVPSVNLVTNVGYGESATHLKDSSHPLAQLPVRPMSFPLRHPPEVEVLEERDLAMWELAASGKRVERARGLGPRIVQALRRGPRRSVGAQK